MHLPFVDLAEGPSLKQIYSNLLYSYCHCISAFYLSLIIDHFVYYGQVAIGWERAVILLCFRFMQS